MAERPETLVGEAVVVPVLLLLAQPYAPERVGRRVGGTAIRSCASTVSLIGRPAPVSDPRTSTCPHDRFESGDQSAGGYLHLDAAGGAVVDVRLAVRYDQHLGIGKFLPEQNPQRLRRPFDLDALRQRWRTLQLAHHVAQLRSKKWIGTP